MSVRNAHALCLTALCLVVSPLTAISVERSSGSAPIQYTPYCPGNVGVDYPWPAYSDSPAVNRFRDQIVFAMKALYGFEYDPSTLPEVTVPIGEGESARLITLPQGWVIAMDVLPGVYTQAVAIPPKDGPFFDKDGLNALLTKKKQIFGGGGHVVSTGADGVRLPCMPNDPGTLAPAIVVDIPYKGEDSAEM